MKQVDWRKILPHAELKVVESSLGGGELSLRGPKGRGHGDDVRKHLLGVFEAGETVILIRKSDFEKLINQ